MPERPCPRDLAPPPQPAALITYQHRAATKSDQSAWGSTLSNSLDGVAADTTRTTLGELRQAGVALNGEPALA